LVEGQWISYIRVADKTWQASNVWNRMHAIQEESGASGNLFQFKERESQLFELLKNQQMSLNQLARKLNLPRPVVMNHLAKLMKWNILSEVYVEGKFLYTLKKTTD
jgi:biotin operon repressor